MKASELRIGNYVNVLGQFDKVSLIGENKNVGYCHFEETRPGYYLENHNDELVTGIELTEEWLIKMVFEKHEYKVSDCDYFTKGFVVIMVKDNSFKASVSYLQSRYLTSIQYVHQLQNLYFALTGEELTIKN